MYPANWQIIPQDESEPTRRRHYWLYIAIGISIGMASTVVVMVLFSPPPARPLPDRMTICGNSTVEARANGCVFDLLNYAWLPVACVDSEVTAEYREWISSLERGVLFKDPEGQFPIEDEEELSERMELKTYISADAHAAHCAFSFRKLHRAYHNRTPLDITTAGLWHTKHCSSMLMKSHPWDKIDELRMGFGDCIV